MICLLVLTQFTNVTDTHTDTAWRHRLRLCIASRSKNSTISFCVWCIITTNVISVRLVKKSCGGRFGPKCQNQRQGAVARFFEPPHHQLVGLGNAVSSPGGLRGILLLRKHVYKYRSSASVSSDLKALYKSVIIIIILPKPTPDHYIWGLS